MITVPFRSGEHMKQHSVSISERVAYPDDRSWEVQEGRIVLLASRCESCEKVVFPARETCDRCWAELPAERVPLAGQGVLYSFSEVHIAPPDFEVPYLIGYVDFPDDVRVFGQLRSESQGFELGDLVVPDLDVIRVQPDGTEVESYVFRPASEVSP
jgi:uncharacterized protein